MNEYVLERGGERVHEEIDAAGISNKKKTRFASHYGDGRVAT